MKPLVSAIIPTYNKSDLVVEAVDSVLGQTYGNIELIIVDDGSSDNTGEVLKKYGNRIKYFYKENGGNADARNYGIRKAQGKYIGFLDHDDIWHSERIEKLIGFLEKNRKYGAVMSETEYIDMKGRVIRHSNYNKTFPQDGTDMPYALKNLPGCFSNLVARKEIIDRVGELDEELKAASDLDYFLRITAISKIALLPEYLLRYRKTKTSLSNNIYTGNRLNVLEKFKKTYPELAKKHKRIIERTVNGIHLSYAEDLLWSRDVVKARKELAESMNMRDIPRIFHLFCKSFFIEDKGSFENNAGCYGKN